MSIRVTLLGTGTSAGVPMIGCRCAVCTSADPRDRRDRPGALVRYVDEDGVERLVLIDTPPELRLQMLRHAVMRLDAVLYTHEHADHVFGLDDLRRFNAVQRRPIDAYGEPRVLDVLRAMFGYVFNPESNVNQSFVPDIRLHSIQPGQVLPLFGSHWLPLRLMHGQLPILGYRLGGFAYCTDVHLVPEATLELLSGLDLLVLGALRHRPHPTHLTVAQALAVIERLRPARTVLTHIAHDLAHADLERDLPARVRPGYDGLTLEVADG